MDNRLLLYNMDKKDFVWNTWLVLGFLPYFTTNPQGHTTDLTIAENCYSFSFLNLKYLVLPCPVIKVNGKLQNPILAGLVMA